MGSAAAPEHEPPPGLWASVWEAIRGTEQDFTEGRISRAILLLSIPMVLEMAMESLFGIVDVFFVAKLGPDAVATVGLTEGMLTMVFAISLGIGMATTAMVARRIGEKDTEGASIAAVQGIWLGIAASVLVGAIGLLLAPTLLEAMGASPAILAGGATYTTIILGGATTVVFLFLNNAIFRGAGDAVMAMQVLWVANGINIILDPCLIFGLGPFPELGLTGAAIATTTGRGIGVLLQFAVLFRGHRRVRVQRRHLTVDPTAMRRLIRVSITGMLQYLVATASWLALIRIIATFGSAALAGYTIAIRIVVFAFLPAWGLSNAAATLVGQNLGAKKPDRAETSVWQTGLYNMVFLGLVSVVFIALSEFLVGLFTDESEVIPIGANCLRIVSYGYIFYAWGVVMEQSFNGAGDTTTPTIINLFCYWLWQIPIAYALAITFELGPQGVFWAIAISESTLALVAMVAFRRGKWKQQKI
ncbi:MAG: MATE family efflux transporter [bacterium]|nr:MATE family efflux transporter [bacterium]